MERSQIINVEPSGEQSNNRLFIILAIALLGLICVGLVGLAGAVYLYQANFAEQAALPTPTIFVPVETATFTPTPSPTSTNTPLPTATGTPVVSGDGQEVASPEDQTPAETAAPEEEPAETPVSEEGPAEAPTATATNPLALPTVTEEVELTPTSTMVVQPPAGESAETSEPESTAVPASTPEMPGSGGILSSRSNFLIWAGVIMLALLGIGVFRQFVSSRRA